jgi:protocatechuate 3,4-dioxygenase beta subunit
LTTDCKPVKGALLDFWQADANGQYDNQGYKMRGHQYTDENGQFRLETVIPGLYPGRTRHIHVKAQAPNQSILTTQLYFPGEARNQSDSLFNQSLQMQMQDSTGGTKQGAFNFVLKVG